MTFKDTIIYFLGADHAGYCDIIIKDIENIGYDRFKTEFKAFREKHRRTEAKAFIFRQLKERGLV